MFDRDLIFDKHNLLDHKAQDFLFRFKTRIVECGTNVTTKLFDCLSQRGLALLFVLLLLFVVFMAAVFSMSERHGFSSPAETRVHRRRRRHRPQRTATSCEIGSKDIPSRSSHFATKTRADDTSVADIHNHRPGPADHVTTQYMAVAAGRASLPAHHLRRSDIREPLTEPNAACVVRACDGSDDVHQHTARSSKSRTGRHPGSPSKPQSTQAALAISRVGCTSPQGRGVSRGAPALGGPFGRAEGVVHSWMD